MIGIGFRLTFNSEIIYTKINFCSAFIMSPCAKGSRNRKSIVRLKTRFKILTCQYCSLFEPRHYILDSHANPIIIVNNSIHVVSIHYVDWNVFGFYHNEFIAIHRNFQEAIFNVKAYNLFSLFSIQNSAVQKKFSFVKICCWRSSIICVRQIIAPNSNANPVTFLLQMLIITHHRGKCYFLSWWTRCLGFL